MCDACMQVEKRRVLMREGKKERGSECMHVSTCVETGNEEE